MPADRQEHRARRQLLACATLIICGAVGCVPKAPSLSDVQDGADAKIGRDDSDVVDDTVVVDHGPIWIEKGIAVDDVTIDLGYQHDAAGGVQWLEPVTVITRNGTSVANAMVFNGLVSADGRDVAGEEIATVYDPPSDIDSGRYGRGKLRLPDGTPQCVVRFRIVLPSGKPAWTRDVTIQLGSARKL